MSRARRVPAAALAALALVTAGMPAAAPALAAAQVGIADVEDEVMCPICGTLLELSNSPQAQRERAFVARLIAQGKSKEQIKDALVAQYGRDVLALPEGSGFNISAYLLPAIGFAVAAVALAAAAWRWRRAAGEPGSGRAGAAAPQGEDAERLDADIARYDL